MQMRTRNSQVPKILLLIAVAYSITLLILSLMNLKSLPKFEVTNVDKIFHTTAYFGLVVVWYLQYFAHSVLKKSTIRPLISICLFAIVFGMLIEVLQGTATSYRSWDVFDMLANFTGTLLAFILLRLLKNTLEKLKMRI